MFFLCFFFIIYVCDFYRICIYICIAFTPLKITANEAMKTLIGVELDRQLFYEQLHLEEEATSSDHDTSYDITIPVQERVSGFNDNLTKQTKLIGGFIYDIIEWDRYFLSLPENSVSAGVDIVLYNTYGQPVTFYIKWR